MSTQAESQVSQSGKAPKVIPMRVTIEGRIDAMRRWDGVRYTRVITPSPDRYTRPQVVELRSKAQLGERGEEITVAAVLGGFLRKSFQATDKDTGERTLVTPVEMTLDVLE